jgi:hypothetical protein
LRPYFSTKKVANISKDFKKSELTASEEDLLISDFLKEDLSVEDPYK